MKLLHVSPTELHQKLMNYLHVDASFCAVFKYTKKRFGETAGLPAHNWAHIYRDILNAIVVGEAEKANMNIVLPAITMHDIGFLYGADGKTHGAVGAEKLATYLKDTGAHYSPKMVESIASCIRTHKAVCIMKNQLG